MDKALTELMNAALNTPESEDAREAYIECLNEKLAVEPIDQSVITTAVNGVTIDHATCVRDQIESADKKHVEAVLKALKNNKELKSAKTINAFRFACVLLASVIGNKDLRDAMLPFVFIILTPSGELDKIYCSKVQGIALKEYYLMELPAVSEYPKWKSIKCKAKTALRFIAFIESFLQQDTNTEDKELMLRMQVLKRWAQSDKLYLEEKLEKEEWEASRPARKTDELIALAEHYKKTDEALDNLHEENKALKKEIWELREVLSNGNSEISKLSGIITAQQYEIEAAKKSASEYKNKLNESVSLASSLETYREDSESAMLQDIGNALRAEYEDFIASVNDDMDIELGEIYREKLKSIFRILEGKGIKV